MRKRLRSTMKWSGTVLTVLLLVVWVGSGYWGSYLDAQPSIEVFVDSGVVRVSWQEPWVFPPPAVHWWGPEGNDQPFEWKFDAHRALSRTTPGAHVLVTIPIWAFALLAALPTAWLWYRDRRRAPGLCIKCGYDLRGNASGVCPECGSA